MNTVTVIGSINLDRTIRVKAMARPGVVYKFFRLQS